MVKKLPTSSVESTLIDVGSFGISICQKLGYFSFSVIKKNNEQQLKFKLFSIPVFTAFLFVGFQFGITGAYVYFRDNLTDLLKVFRKTELLVLSLSGYMISFHTISQRLLSIFFHNRIKRRWNDFVKCVEKISLSDPDGSFLVSCDEGAKYCSIFRKARKQGKKGILTSLGIIVVFALVFTLTSIYISLFSKETPKNYVLERPSINLEKLLLTLSIVSWNLFGVLHIYNAVWINFQPSIINACLEMIEAELSQMYNVNIETKIKDPDIFILKSITEKDKDKFKGSNVESKLNICISNYYQICDMVKCFQREYGTRISMEILYNSLLVLCYLFNGFTWMGRGFKYLLISFSI